MVMVMEDVQQVEKSEDRRTNWSLVSSSSVSFFKFHVLGCFKSENLTSSACYTAGNQTDAPAEWKITHLARGGYVIG